MRQIQAVVIERADGMRATLDASDRVRDHQGRPLALWQIPDALTNPAAWIEYDTKAEYQEAGAEEREPWQAVTAVEYRALARVYARAVVEVMVVYDEAVDP